MKRLRTIFVGLVALSLAALPVAAAKMRGAMTAGVSGYAAAHTDCCSGMEPCEKHNGCDQSGACAAKCSLIPATTVAGMDMTGPMPSSARSSPVVNRFNSALEHPPLPPPRV
jgi:hypothetical protein